MSNKFPVIALVGRTNVGKSTLFNRLADKNIAVVEDLPGVTRDRNYAIVTKHEKIFCIVDTGGLVGEQDKRLSSEVLQQTLAALSEADVVVCMFDGTIGIQPDDHQAVRLVRASKKPIIWVANKCEKPASVENANEFYQLGINELLCISAAHNKGIRDLVAKIQEQIEESPEKLREEAASEEAAIRVAVIGKPNVGKSTLINKILNQDRLVTSDISGTTRDSVYINLVRDGQNFTIVDTAGLRKKAKVEEESLEYAFNTKTLSALAEADVIVLMIDATDGKPSEQDTKIAGLVHDRGKPILIVVNKWDLVEKDHKSVKTFTTAVYDGLKFLSYAPIIFISALSGRRCPSILQKVKYIHELANKKIKTSDVNKVLQRAFDLKQSPAYRGQVLKLFYATQTNTMPPTFMLFVNHPRKINFSYERYLKNQIRKEFDFEGSDIRLVFKKRGKETEDNE